MPHCPGPHARNFGYGRRLDYAGAQALRSHFGGGHFATVQAHAERWRLFAQWCRTQGIGDARQVDRPLLSRYADTLRHAVARGELAIATAHNRLSSLNRTLEALRGDRQMRLSSPRQALGQARVTVRNSAPAGQTGVALAPLLADLQADGSARVAAIVGLARAGGLRLREAILADLPRLLREARAHGAINIQDGTKGGRRGASAPRWIPVTDDLRTALAQASAVAPHGSRNLLAPQETYARFLSRHVRPAREHLHRHGLKGFHELRAAYACDRYQAITGHPAPVLGGTLHRSDRRLDRLTRQQISRELGHHRIDVVSAYVGGRR